MMTFEDKVGLTHCERCGAIENAYYRLPVLQMIVCRICHFKWDRWGLGMFKEMIGFE